MLLGWSEWCLVDNKDPLVVKDILVISVYYDPVLRTLLTV